VETLGIPSFSELEKENTGQEDRPFWLDIKDRSIPLHFHLMESLLFQALMTRPFG
jgi:hypothetical protein